VARSFSNGKYFAHLFLFPAEIQPWQEVRQSFAQIFHRPNYIKEESYKFRMERIYYGWWIVLANFTIVFYVAGTIFYGFTAFIEPLVSEFGWSYTQVSLASSIRGLEMGLMAPVVGLLVDRFGCRRLLFIGIIVLGAGIILLGLTQSLLMFYGSFVLIAFGAGGCTSVVSLTVVANWFDRNVSKALGVMVSGFGASGLIVPIIVWLIGAYGWRTAAIVLGLGMWIIGLPMACIVRNKPEDYGYYPNGKRSEDCHRVPSEGNVSQTDMRFKEVLKKRAFLFLNLSEAIRLMTLTAVVTHIMPYLSTMNFSRITAGLVAAGIPLLSVIGRFGFGWVGDLVEKKYAMVTAFSFMGLGALCLGYVTVSVLFYIFIFFFSVGYGGLTVLRGAFLREYYGRKSFGKLVGIMLGFGAGGGVIGPTAAGWVFDRAGSYHLVWLVFTGLIGMAILLLLTVESKAKLST
jgi:sugar phosphate permease